MMDDINSYYAMVAESDSMDNNKYDNQNDYITIATVSAETSENAANFCTELLKGASSQEQKESKKLKKRTGRN
jgi:hypothetical protein